MTKLIQNDIYDSLLKHEILNKLLQNTKIVLLSVVLLTVIATGIFSFAFAQEESKIPTWIKTMIGFWINGQVSDDEFLGAIEYFVDNELILVNSDRSNSATIENLKLLQSETNFKIEHIRKLVNLPQIQDTLKESNLAFSQTNNPETILQQIDQRWNDSDPDTIDSVAYNLIHNSAGDIIRSEIDHDQKSESQFKYAEIFITNEYGGNIAQSHKTSDFRQDDEIWWQKAKQHGLFLSEGGHDESADVYASDIAIKILDENGNFIGILKAVVNIESITELSRGT